MALLRRLVVIVDLGTQLLFLDDGLLLVLRDSRSLRAVSYLNLP